MEKTVEYYLGLPYTLRLIPETGGGWFVEVAELPGCMSEGNDPGDAIAMIREAMQGWLEIALEDGIPIPEPRELEQYSGKFVVRVPRWLHRELVRTTDQEGVSLNHFVSTVLARAVGEQATTPGSTARPEAAAKEAAFLKPARAALASLTTSLKRGDITEALRLAGEMAPLLRADSSGPLASEGGPQRRVVRGNAGRKGQAEPAMPPAVSRYVIPHAAGVVSLADKDADEPAPKGQPQR